MSCSNEPLPNQIIKDRKPRTDLFDFQKYLYVSDDSTFESMEVALKQPRKVVRLSLDDNDIDSLSLENFQNFENLKQVSIWSKRLDEIPSWIGELNQLVYLDFNLSNLNTVPKSLFRLNNLVELTIIGGDFKTVPSEISQLDNLRSLWLAFNHLDSLPQSIGKLERLENLMIESNNLKSIPESISNLERLDKISFYNNLISDYPQNIKNLKKLRTLNLEANLLKKSQLKEIMELLPSCNIYVEGQFRQKEKSLNQK